MPSKFTLSKEQEDIINAALSPKTNVIVQAAAGCGKTSTIIHLAKLIDNNKKILLVTYNSRLKDETREKVKKHKLNDKMEVYSYHAFGYKYFTDKCRDDQVMQQIVNNQYKQLHKINFDYIIIDEIQDMTPLLYKFMMKIINLNEIHDPQLILLGDRRQCIYQFNNADYRYLTKGKLLFSTSNEWKELTLSMSFRITKQMSNFINKILFNYENNDIITAKKRGAKPRYIIYSQYNMSRYNCSSPIFSRLAHELNYYIEEKKVKPHDIFILAPSVKHGLDKYVYADIDSYCKYKNIPLYGARNDDEALNDKVINKKLVYATYHQTKGLERKCVIVLSFDIGYFMYYSRNLPLTQCPNTIYVAVTRALQYLTVFHHCDNNYFPFMILDKDFEKTLSKYCDVFKYKPINKASDEYPPTKKLISMQDMQIILSDGISRQYINSSDIVGFNFKSNCNDSNERYKVTKIDNCDFYVNKINTYGDVTMTNYNISEAGDKIPDDVMKNLLSNCTLENIKVNDDDDFINLKSHAEFEFNNYDGKIINISESICEYNGLFITRIYEGYCYGKICMNIKLYMPYIENEYELFDKLKCNKHTKMCVLCNKCKLCIKCDKCDDCTDKNKCKVCKNKEECINCDIEEMFTDHINIYYDHEMELFVKIGIEYMKDLMNYETYENSKTLDYIFKYIMKLVVNESVRNGVRFRERQINNYDWVETNKLMLCLSRLNKCIYGRGTKITFETFTEFEYFTTKWSGILVNNECINVPIFESNKLHSNKTLDNKICNIKSMDKRWIGRIDMIKYENKCFHVYEIKTVNELKDNHKLQLIFYAISHMMNKNNNFDIMKYYLYNILDNSLIKISFTKNQLMNILNIYCNYKFTVKNMISDNEFLELNKDYINGNVNNICLINKEDIDYDNDYDDNDYDDNEYGKRLI